MNIFALALEYLWLGISQICWIQIIDWNNGLITVESTPISIWIILWGIDAFLLIMGAMIKTKGLFKYV